MLLVRGHTTMVLPDDYCELQAGDEILFAGSRDARRDMQHVLRNANVAEYVMTGHNVLGGAIWRWIGGQHSPAG